MKRTPNQAALFAPPPPPDRYAERVALAESISRHGWRQILGRLVPGPEGVAWSNWCGVFVWPEPAVWSEGLAWALIEVAVASHDSELSVPLRFGLARAASVEELAARVEGLGPYDRGSAGWSFGTLGAGADEVAAVNKLAGDALFWDLHIGETREWWLFNAVASETLRRAVPEAPFAETLCRWALGDGLPNGLLRGMSYGARPGLPTDVAEAIACAAGDNRWYAGALALEADRWLARQALLRASPRPWRWPPWSPTGEVTAEPVSINQHKAPASASVQAAPRATQATLDLTAIGRG